MPRLALILLFWLLALPVAMADDPVAAVASAGPDITLVDTDFDGFATVTLDATGSTPGDGSISSYSWTLDTILLATTATAETSLPLGVHHIFLTVTGENGLPASDEIIIRIVRKEFTNGSFESGFEGWTSSGSVDLQSTSPYTTTDGTRLVAFNTANQPANGVLSQSFATIPGGFYQIDFDAGLLSFNNSEQHLQVEVTGCSTSATLASQSHILKRADNLPVRWEGKTLNFTADGNGAILRFRDLSPATAGLDLTLDNVRLRHVILHTLQVGSAVLTDAAITMDPPDHHGEGNATGGFSRIYRQGTSVRLKAEFFRNGCRFEKWRLDGMDLATTREIQLAMENDHQLEAVYQEFPVNLPPSLKVMPIGDSVTNGVGGTNAGYRGFLYQLLSPAIPDFSYLGTSLANPGQLPLSPVDERHHQGMPSYNMTDISNNLDGFDNTRFLVFGGTDRNPMGGHWLTGGNGTGREPVYPDAITLMIGTNELDFQEGLPDRLRILVEKITTLRPEARLFLARIIPVLSQTAEVEAYNKTLSAMAAEFRAEGKNIHLVDLYDGFPAGGLTADGAHPNDTGYRWMAERWHEAIFSSYLALPSGHPPVITTQPEAVTCGFGSSATFRVEAAGAPGLEYQWRFNGEPMPEETGPVLLIQSIHPLHSGRYDVIVSNANGSVSSAAASLSVVMNTQLANGSFEDGYAGWSVAGSQELKTATAPYSATDGSKLIAFNTVNSLPGGVLSQTFATIPGATYTITFDAGVLAFNSGSQKLQVTWNNQAGILFRNFTLIGTGNGIPQWFPQTATFVADGTFTTLAFRDISATTSTIDLLLDNILITVTPPPPRPSLGTPTLDGPAGDRVLRLETTETGIYILEISPDLRHWDRLATILATPGAVEFPLDATLSAPDPANPDAPLPPARFLRIGKLPGSPPP